MSIPDLDKGAMPPQFSRTAYDVIGLVASAGGLHALSVVLSGLPANFPAAVTVVQHLDRRHPSMLVQILRRRTAVMVLEATQGCLLAPGVVYVAPPDRHLLVEADGTLSLTQTRLVHFVRPSADILFESLAASYRHRAIGVVLSGSGSDGNLGVQALRKLGGLVLAQDAETSEFFGMPASAIQTGCVDLVLPLEAIARVLMELVEARFSQEKHDDLGR